LGRKVLRLEDDTRRDGTELSGQSQSPQRGKRRRRRRNSGNNFDAVMMADN
jgi:hypothetical protein